MTLPKPIIDVVEAARLVVHRRKDLHEAIASGEINDAGIEKRRRALKSAIRALEKVVVELERQLEAGKKRGAATPVPWGSIFGAVTEFAGLVGRVKAGERGPGVIGDAGRWAAKHGPGRKPPSKKAVEDIIDGEIVDE